MLNHPLFITTWSFILVGLLGGLLQANHQKKSFALEAQLNAHDVIISEALSIQSRIRFLSDGKKLYADLSPSQEELRVETRQAINKIAAHLEQVQPLNGEDWSNRKSWIGFRSAILCVDDAMVQKKTPECTSLSLDSRNATVFAAKLKREFLQHTYQNTRPWEYLIPW